MTRAVAERALEDAFQRGYHEAAEEVRLAPALALWAGISFGFCLGVIVMGLFGI